MVFSLFWFYFATSSLSRRERLQASAASFPRNQTRRSTATAPSLDTHAADAETRGGHERVALSWSEALFKERKHFEEVAEEYSSSGVYDNTTTLRVTRMQAK